MDFNILDFGAVADGKTMNTNAIQAAIDECAKEGGRVIVPAGTFMSGSIFLKSNVELHLAHNATLRASDKLEDYNEEDAYEQNWGSVKEGWNGKHFIMAVECENVAITGTGTIDGNSHVFFEPYRPPKDYDKNSFVNAGYCWKKGSAANIDKVNRRPGQMICFVECKNIVVRDVSMINSTCWSCFVYGCDFVRISGVRIDNTFYHLNTDGIDIDTSRYVTISDCIILTGDDCITFRGCGNRLKDKDRCCEYVTVTNCVLSASAAAFRIGVGTFPVRHITVSNVSVLYCGEFINYCAEWANTSKTPFDDIIFSNCAIEHTNRLLTLKVNHGTPVKNLKLHNVTAKALSAAMIYSTEPGVIENFLLDNVDVVSVGNDVVMDADAPKDMTRAFANFYNVDNLTFKNSSFTVPEEHAKDYETDVELINCKNFRNI